MGSEENKVPASHEPRASSAPARSELEARSAKQTYSYIERCFRWAHEADPQALLFYHEAGAGFQLHIANLPADVASISANIKRFTALGVQVHITEMDVALPVDARGNPRPEDLQKQADIYREIADACLSHRGCTAI